jgi:hypothetical protein
MNAQIQADVVHESYGGRSLILFTEAKNSGERGTRSAYLDSHSPGMFFWEFMTRPNLTTKAVVQ